MAALAVGVWTGSRAWAAGPDEAMLDAAALMQMEQRAKFAEPREQCYLYAEVLHGLTELAGRQIAAGDEGEAHLTMMRIDEVAGDLHKSSAKNAKRLKNAEMMLQHTTHRLEDMARVVSTEERSAVQSTLKHMTAVHNELLALVFAR